MAVADPAGNKRKRGLELRPKYAELEIDCVRPLAGERLSTIAA
jgi:hypothetical protein